MQISVNRPYLSPKKPTLDEWDDLMKPDEGQGSGTVVGRRENEPLPQSIDEVRDQVSQLTYHPIDPYVASVAGSIGAGQTEIPKGETEIGVRLPGYYDEEVEVTLGAHNGPGRPLLVILPGIYSTGEGSHSLFWKKLALERGMNYLMLPNSMSNLMLEDKPLYHPGNPRVDALWSHELIKTLKDKYPEYFSSISVAGYSYGALMGANLVRLDEEKAERLINGNLVAISPPENLEHSMQQLDGLREIYGAGNEAISDTGLYYKHDVKKYGYANFLQSKLSEHGPGSNRDEVEICDKYGSRDSLKEMIEVIDTQFGHNQLPMNTEEYKQANWWDKLRMRQQHKDIVANITYDQLSNQWMNQDAWLAQQGLTPSEMTARYSFSNAIAAIEKTPVMMLASADDYILAPEDVGSLQNLATGPLEISRVFDTGGHVGVDWNPEVALTMIDFAAARELKADDPAPDRRPKS